MFFRQVDHHQPAVIVDLGGGQPDAVGGVHGFGHVVDQTAQGVVDNVDRPGYRVQPFVGVMQDVE